MTLKTEMAADVSAVFLDTDEFASSVTHRPLGVSADDVAVTAIVELDFEDGSGLAGASGEPHETQDGERDVRYAAIEISTSVSHDYRDQWVISSEVWHAVRVLSRDDDMQRILLRRWEGASTRRMRRK